MTQLTDAYHLDNFIDTFALGHYARVLLAFDRRTQAEVAFKVLRPEHLLADGDMRWEYRAFGNEALLLHALKDSPNVVRLLDCGFVSSIAEAPDEGEIVTFGTNASAFNRALYEHALKGWRPYLALEHLPRNNNLFYLMRGNQSKSWRLPSEEGLSLALQFAQVLQLAHHQHIAYFDHKLEHVYWDGVQLRLIDFNSSKQLAPSMTMQDVAKDLHHLCVGILYPVFTGMSPQKGSLRPQPGGLETVESRYADITELDFPPEAQLSEAIQELLRRGASMAYSSVGAFVEDLQRVAARHGRDFPAHASTPANRHARDMVRKGLKELREGTGKLRSARDTFREALLQDDLAPDMEDELRRLVKALNDMLHHRVIP
jgi:hypothetical protein